MNTIQSPPPGMLAPGAAELNAVRATQAPAVSRGLADVILLAGIAAAKNNELRIKACYQEVLAMARWMENLRLAKTAIGNQGWLPRPEYRGYTQFGPDGKPMIDGAGWHVTGSEPSPQPSTCTRKDRWGHEVTLTRSPEFQAYLEAKAKNPDDPNLKQLWNEHLRSLGYGKRAWHPEPDMDPGKYPPGGPIVGWGELPKSWEQVAMENDPAGYSSYPRFKITNPDTGQVGHAQLTDYVWGDPCRTMEGSVEGIGKKIDEAIANFSAKQQIAMQDLQSAVSKQNELNQLISQNMSKLHEVAQASLQKMG